MSQFGISCEQGGRLKCEDEEEVRYVYAVYVNGNGRM